MRYYVLLLAILVALVGCSTGSIKPQSEVHVELVEFGPNRTLLTLDRQEWGGIVGAHGFVGYENARYYAKLKGSGPEFVDLRFKKPSDPSTMYRGTVQLDLEHGQARVEMREILSKPDRPERSRRHGVSGTYTISIVRRANEADVFAHPDSTW